MLDFRVLNYFLTIAREESITRAAKALHLSQPTLSRQIKNMEDVLGKQLLIREPRRILLTEDGLLLRKRAEEILALVDKTENELLSDNDVLTGDIFIGSGEADNVHFITRTAHELQQQYPDIHFHIQSGAGALMMEQLDNGLIDFAVVYGNIDEKKYEKIPCQGSDAWGVLMRRDNPLSSKKRVTAEDLWREPLIMSSQTVEVNNHANDLQVWLKKSLAELNITATYSLAYNASLMVSDGMGICIMLEKIINVSGNTDLCFRPLEPAISDRLHIVWKRHQVFPKATRKFLELLQQKNREKT